MRDTGMIFQPIKNLSYICGWRLDLPIDPVKNGFTVSPTPHDVNLLITWSSNPQ